MENKNQGKCGAATAKIKARPRFIAAVGQALAAFKAPPVEQYRKPMDGRNPMWWRTNAKQRRLMRLMIKAKQGRTPR